MFPPVDDRVLDNNPDFARLYKTLTTSILTPDGTSRRSKESKENEAIRQVQSRRLPSTSQAHASLLTCACPLQQADQHRMRAANQHLLARAIAAASPADQPRAPGTRAPSDSYTARDSKLADSSLLDLLLVLPPLLHTPSSVSPDVAALLLTSAPLSDMPVLAPPLAALVSANLHAAALALTQLTHPLSSPSTVQRHIPALEHDYTSLRDQLAAAHTHLLAGRLRAVSALTQLLHMHAEMRARLVRCLEVKHGPVAQSLELRAAEVALLAQRAEAEAAQTLVGLHAQVYSPEVVSALRTYGAHLRDAKIRGAERVRNLQRELKEYGVDADDGGGSAKEKTMREMAKAHEEIGRQVDEVTLDLKRLHTQ
ncbi:hypothetical protein CCM_07488 [Cordyceps militaris CM01]|uniref:HAUS augmin-like complex subunit 4 n=1 Tax=Cordyceps militaris (strain CM01) TaxID=983644 RepID=G3JPY5_CORMM|nr:uncharacterized protein CCM_07488 [Cordyceps militaris CM01]EGX89236.1 hypothetical protein CCM_07488 [Cordyceps militaris CM01]